MILLFTLGSNWSCTHHEYSPYQAFDNNPIFWADPSGADSEKEPINNGLPNKDTFLNREFGYKTSSGTGDGETEPKIHKGPGTAVGSGVQNQLDTVVINATKTDYASGIRYGYQYNGSSKSYAEKFPEFDGMSLSGMLSYWNRMYGKEFVSFIDKSDREAHGKMLLHAMGLSWWGGTSYGRPINMPRKFSFKGGLAPKTKSMSPYGLEGTQPITRSKKEFQRLVNDIKVNGITEPIEYSVNNGTRYIVNGHHRAYISKRLGISNIPVRQVPYQPNHSVIEPGKNPGYLNYIKY